MGMRNNTIAITAESFEKLFVHNFHNTVGLDLECRSNDQSPEAMNRYYPDSADWRQMAWKALVNKELGDARARWFYRCLSGTGKSFFSEMSKVSIQRKPHGSWASQPGLLKPGCAGQGTWF